MSDTVDWSDWWILDTYPDVLASSISLLATLFLVPSVRVSDVKLSCRYLRLLSEMILYSKLSAPCRTIVHKELFFSQLRFVLCSIQRQAHFNIVFEIAFKVKLHN